MTDRVAHGSVEVRGLRLAYSERGPGGAHLADVQPGPRQASRANAERDLGASHLADSVHAAGYAQRADPYPRGGPDAPPRVVVLVHGLGSSRRIWDLVAPQLAARYRVLALDQRGHGESDQPETGYDFASIVADLDAFLCALDVDEPVVLVGHSWGASVVLHFAVLHADRTAGIVLVDGGTASPGERSTWEETLARLTPPDIDGLRWEDLRQRMSSWNGMYEDPRVAAVGRSLFHFDAEGRISRRLKIANHLRILRALWEQRPAELLPLVQCPVLLLPARQTADAAEWSAAKVVSAQRALELQPKARLRWFEDTVHDVPLQRPHALAAELLGFADQAFAVQVYPAPVEVVLPESGITPTSESTVS